MQRQSFPFSFMTYISLSFKLYLLYLTQLLVPSSPSWYNSLVLFFYLLDPTTSSFLSWYNSLLMLFLGLQSLSFFEKQSLKFVLKEITETHSSFFGAYPLHLLLPFFPLIFLISSATNTHFFVVAPFC